MKSSNGKKDRPETVFRNAAVASPAQASQTANKSNKIQV
tara:strand:- start:46 stop:162 length:117 start_codon:yes stop_codon:yes gene_type:complete